MAIYGVVTNGDAILRETAREVTKFDDRVQRLVGNMIETVILEDGVGLAAPQIGISKRVIIAFKEEKEGFMEVVNPVIIEEEGEQIGTEGCLSVPGKIGMVKRAQRIRVIGKTALGEDLDFVAVDMFARIIQHEVDHLNGVLFIDRASDIEDIR